MADIRVGTSAFTAAGWAGSFYPKGMKSTDYLSFYATRFDAVELDNTFYATPAITTVKNWYAKTPPSFLFAAKVPQICCGPSYVVLIFHRLVSRGLGAEQHHIRSSRHWKPCHVGAGECFTMGASPARPTRYIAVTNCEGIASGWDHPAISIGCWFAQPLDRRLRVLALSLPSRFQHRH
jgi:uncharacterized protein YecE (DUF72 family)